MTLSKVPYAFALCTLFFLPSNALAFEDSLRTKIEHIVRAAHANVGVAVVDLHNNDTLTVNGNDTYPMQSVYKFPLALAVLSQVDKGTFSLQQTIRIRKSDLLPNTWSPLRERYPHGNISITLGELLTYTVSESDNNGCDVLFRLLGGPRVVDQYIHSLGVMDIAIATTEEEMHRAWEIQYRNWSSPAAMGQLLSLFYHDKILSIKSKEYLWQLMVNTKTGPGRLKGLLPEGTIVAHKSGSSGTNENGIAAATNDVGIISLPNGKHVAIAVFVSNCTVEEEACEKTIAQIAKMVWDVYSHK